MTEYQDPNYASPVSKTPALTIWKTVALSPSVESFARYRDESEIGRAVIWVAITTLITSIVSFLTTLLRGPALGNLERLQEFLPPEIASELPETMPMMGAQGIGTLGSALCGIPTAVIMGLIGAFIGVGLVHLAARLLQGEGTFTETFFLAAAASVPVTIATAALNLIAGLFGLIPAIGPILAGLLGILVFGVSIYGLVLSAMSVAAAHRFTLGKGFASVLLPTVVILLLCCCTSAALAAIIAALGGSMEEILREISALLTLLA